MCALTTNFTLRREACQIISLIHQFSVQFYSESYIIGKWKIEEKIVVFRLFYKCEESIHFLICFTD